jgi:hypothetical protein
MTSFLKWSGFITLLLGWVCAFVYHNNLWATVLCWGYTAGAYGLVIGHLEEELSHDPKQSP